VSHLARTANRGPGMPGLGAAFAALMWLCLGAIIASILRIRLPTGIETLGRVFMPAGK
jgi:hypothetical protein